MLPLHFRFNFQKSETPGFLIHLENDWHQVRTVYAQPNGNRFSGYKLRQYKLNDYWTIYSQLTGKPRQPDTLDTFLKIAFDEWLERVK